MSSSKSAKMVKFLSQALLKLSDFNGDEQRATAFAEGTIETIRQISGDGQELKDRVVSIIVNVKNLDGEFGDDDIDPKALATMDPAEMLSNKQRRILRRQMMKRARDSTITGSLSPLCDTCGLMRRDRVNINNLSLDDSEDHGVPDRDFENMCECPYSSAAPSRTSSSSRSGSSPDRSRARAGNDSGEAESAGAKEEEN